MTAVGFVGLGSMGKSLSTNLIEAGFDLMVYDVRPEPVQELVALGARAASSCAEVGQFADIVEMAVTDDATTLEATLGEDGVLARARPGSLIVIHSTVHPSTVLAVDEAARAKGVEVMDAQMVGGRTTVEAHNQTFMCGGSAEALERLRPLLLASGPHIFHMGGVGKGAATKAAQQVITVISILAASEAYQLAEKAGVDIDAFQALMQSSEDQIRFAAHWPQFLAQRRPDPRPFYRGLRPILRLGFELDLPMPATALAWQTIPWVTGVGYEGDVDARFLPGE